MTSIAAGSMQLAPTAVPLSAPSYALPTATLAPPTTSSTPSTPAFDEDRLLTSGIGVVGNGVLGGVTGAAIRNVLAAGPAAGASRFATGWSAVTSGAARSIGFGTAISVGLNVLGSGVLLAIGKISKGQAAGAIAANSVSAVLGSTGAVMLGGAATAALGAIGVAGLPLTLAGIGFGMVAGGAVSAIFRKSGAQEGIFNAVSGAIDN